MDEGNMQTIYACLLMKEAIAVETAWPRVLLFEFKSYSYNIALSCLNFHYLPAGSIMM